MAVIPENNHTTVAQIDRRYEETQERARAHLGASVIGDECERLIWHSFRWSLQPKFIGRLLRLFQYGHDAEADLHKWLRSTGARTYALDPETGRQFNFQDIGGHFAGSCDGFAEGLTEAPSTKHLLEFKTSSEKKFKELQKNGVAKTHPRHIAQMQIYMHFFGVKRAFYLVLNKNNHDLYSERLKYDKKTALALIEKAKRIIESNEPPARISERPDWYVCSWCDYKALCHENQIPEVNCRNCVHSTPVTEGDAAHWKCSFHGDNIPRDFQYKGCDKHLYLPSVVPWDQVDADPDNNLIKYECDGRAFFNGEKDEDIYPSKELRFFNPKLLDDEVVKAVSDNFGPLEFVGVSK